MGLVARRSRHDPGALAITRRPFRPNWRSKASSSNGRFSYWGLARHGCRGQLQHPLAAYTQTLAQRIVNVMPTLFNDTVGFQEHAPTFSQHSVVSTG